jgi:hypothetical protein
MANQVTLYQLAPDDLALFQTNLQTQPQDWYYRTHPVKYTLNTRRFRTIEIEQIDFDNTIVLLGDNAIFGMGLDNSDTLSSQLEKITGIQCINLGCSATSGGSNNLTLLNLKVLLSEVKPKAFVIGWTDLDRYAYKHMYIPTGAWVPLSPTTLGNNPKKDPVFQAHLNDGTILQLAQQSIADAQDVITSAGVPCIQCTFSDYTKWPAATLPLLNSLKYYASTDLARDLKSPGRETISFAAQDIAQQLKTLNVW